MNDKKDCLSICLIATNGYFRYFSELYESIGQYFFPEFKIQIVIFTDEVLNLPKDTSRIQIKVIPLSHEGWPNVTLLRYQKISNYIEEFKGSHIFWIDIDMIIEKAINEQVLNLATNKMVLSKHPGYVFHLKNIGKLFREYVSPKRNSLVDFLWLQKELRVSRGGLGWENNKESAAYVPLLKRITYVQGGFWFGKKNTVAEMCRILSSNVESDLNLNYIAKWHDESHLNWYASNYPKKFLPVGFVGAENINLLQKEKRFINCVDKGLINKN